MNTPLLDTAQVAMLMPYNRDFLFVDELIELDGERRIVTRKAYSSDNPMVAAHLVGGGGIVPGSILIEQAAQSAFLLGIQTGRVQKNQQVYLARIKAEFLIAVVCPALVDAELVISVLQPHAIGFAATLGVAGKTVARIAGVCAMVLAVGEQA